MQQEPTWSEIIDKQLQAIDKDLAIRRMRIIERPLWASIWFVSYFVLEVGIDGGKTIERPGGSAYREVETWYRDRYGSTLDDCHAPIVNGVVLFYGTPFRIRVPCTVTRPGKPGETCWLRFPNGVLDNEDVTAWLVNPPNLAGIPADQLSVLRSSITEIASALRFLNADIIGATVGDRKLLGLRTGALPHLEATADLLLRHEGESVQLASFA
jgi:hypothetical protein